MSTASQAAFEADAARFDAAFRAAGAIIADEDGSQWIDPAKVPAQLLSAYRLFAEFGYATGLMP
jgi:hypothetical protein